ncbi:MAG: hypothetical protein RMI35_08595 [Leptospiraceae bacterium]|nr:hypothetical protein [Leptospiraceae bacterium]
MDLILYRHFRENKEQSIPKISNEIYVCPFLGIIEHNKIGCLIHPTLTNDPKTQDASFYGASLCQAYDCRVKQEDKENLYYQLIVEFLQSGKFDDYLLMHENVNQEKKIYQNLYYSRFMGDYIFYRFISFYFDFDKILKSRTLLELFFDLCLERIPYNKDVSSFEINYHNFEEDQFEENFKKIFPNRNNYEIPIKKYQPLWKVYVNQNSSS